MAVERVQILLLVALRAAVDGALLGPDEIDVLVLVVEGHRVARREPEALFVVLRLVFW